MYDSLKGKNALVTGGAKGIGKAITERFLKEGAKVYVFDKDAMALGKLSNKYNNGNLKCYVTDISDKEQLIETFCEGGIHSLDILVNNAGIDRDYNFENPDGGVLRDVWGTNLFGSLYVTENVISQMKEKRRGSIIFITSVHNAQAFPHAYIYDSSKHGLVGLMKGIALDYGKYGIRCNAVAPGSIKDAGRTQGISENQEKEFCSNIPLGRLGLSREIANAVVFLASDQSSYITGTQLRVDGGLPIKSALF